MLGFEEARPVPPRPPRVLTALCALLFLSLPISARRPRRGDRTPPAPVTDLRLVSIASNLVTVSWTNTGDDGLVGNATALDFRIRTDGCFALDQEHFTVEAAPPVVDVANDPAPLPTGEAQTFTFDIGAPLQPFSVGLVVLDDRGNMSLASTPRVCGITGAPVWAAAAPNADAAGGVSHTVAPSVDPRLAVNPISGQPAVVWTDRDLAGGDLEAFLREGDGAALAELAGSASGGGVSSNGTASQFADVAYDALGRPIVAWQDVDTAGGDSEVFVRRLEGGAWAEIAGSASGGGVSSNAASSSSPSVAVNPATGRPGVAWVDFQLGDFEVFFREFDGIAWSELAGSGHDQGVSGTPGTSLQPILAYDSFGRPVVAWADDSIGSYEVLLRRFEGGAWRELGGSGTGGGVSRTPGQASLRPSVLVDADNRPCVVWQEALPDGNVEVYGRRFDGTAWVDFGAGSSQGGGISCTPGRSSAPDLARVPGAPDAFLAVWADGSDPQGDSEVYAKWFAGGQWREIGTCSSRLGGVSDTAGGSVSPSCGAALGRAFVCWQELVGSNHEVYLRDLVLLGPVSDSPLEFVVGGGAGGQSQYRVFGNGAVAPAYAPLDLRTAPFSAAYAAASGALHPACGDLDGDGLDEVVLGQGTSFDGNGGFVAILRDHTGRYDQLAMRRFPWTAYAQANGAVYPACGDLDGDGRDEIVLGMGQFSGGGYLAVLDDQQAAFRVLGLICVGSPAYRGGNGETHPACGDVDDDGFDEIVVGLGAGGGGHVSILDDRARGFASIGSIQYPRSPYGASSGATWPACGNLAGGPGAEVVVGPGPGGQGLVYIYGDRSLGFHRIGGLEFPWRAYNAVSGEVRPAVGNLDGDLPLEVVGGSGPFPGAATGGFLFLFEDVTTGSGSRGRFVRYANSNAAYHRLNGETFPATGQLR